MVVLYWQERKKERKTDRQTEKTEKDGFSVVIIRLCFLFLKQFMRRLFPFPFAHFEEEGCVSFFVVSESNPS